MNGENIIVLGDDLGEIASSRKVYDFGDLTQNMNGGGNVRVGQTVNVDENGRGTGLLVDRNGNAVGESFSNVIMIKAKPKFSTTIESITIEI